MESKGRDTAARGGTLLEVLVSLVLVTLVASAVVEAAARRRQAAAEARRAAAGLALAERWRAGRAAGTAWAGGDGGRFEAARAGDGEVAGGMAPEWSLRPAEAAHVPGGATGVPADGQWRRLVISLSPTDPRDAVSFLMRTEDTTLPPAAAAGAAGGGDR
jgi:type II secretory pathway pseudopilin PulG